MGTENVLGYIDNLVAFGIIAPKRRSLILTDQRLLILDVSSMSSTAASAGFAYLFGAFGRGMANRITKDEINEVTKKLSQSNLDELLKSNSDNVGVDNTSVERIELNRKQIVIRAGGKTFKYGLANPEAHNKKSDVYEHYVEVLRAALGDKILAK
jgi:hypothetical protein